MEFAIEDIIKRIQMMNSLIESKEVSEQILIKIVGELTSKYELRQKIQTTTFIEDSNRAIQQLMLYNNTIQLLLADSNMLSGRILNTYHRQIYKLVEFLLHIVQKISNKANIQRKYTDLPSNVCSNCQHYIHQRNIKNMQRQILDFQKYSIQRFDEQLRLELEENQNQSDEDQNIIISEQYFRKKMGVIQKSMNERQNNLLECIDDFESLRTKLLSQIKKRESEGDVKAFNIKEYISQISEHLISNFRKIEARILQFRKSPGSFEDQASQTIEESEKIPNSQRNQLHKQNLKLQAEVKKLVQSKIRLDELCKKYQTELRDSTAKIDAIQNQNKKIREEVFSEKIKANHRQKLLKNAEKTQEKMSKQKQEDEKYRKQSIIAHFQNLLSESGEFAAQFSISIKEYQNNKQSINRDQLAPFIKAAFRKTLDKYTTQKSVMIVPNEKKKAVKNQSVPESPLSKRRSKDKALRMQYQIEGSHQNSRFSIRKIKPNFTISNVINYKINGNIKSQKSLPSQIQIANKSLLNQGIQNNEGHKRKRLAKLSIFSDIRQKSQQRFSKRDIQKRRQSTQFDQAQNQNHFLSTNILNSMPFKKSTFKRNKSQQDLQSLGKIEDAFKVCKVKGQIIDSVAVQKFLFVSPNQKTEHFRDENTQILASPSRNRSKFISNDIQRDPKIQRQKIILTLQELSYLTALFSLLAKVHLINPSQYVLLKEYISSRSKFRLEQDNQNLVIRKMLSEIIVKHRQCNSSSFLCPHLNDFLRSIQGHLLQPLEEPAIKLNLIM